MEWSEEAWEFHNNNETNWWKPNQEDLNYPICGNSSGAKYMIDCLYAIFHFNLNLPLLYFTPLSLAVPKTTLACKVIDCFLFCEDIIEKFFFLNETLGFGRNPDYGYTSFDSFGWALLSGQCQRVQGKLK